MTVDDPTGATADARSARRIVVNELQDGRRLDVVLADELGVSRNAAVQRIDSGGVTVGGRPARRSRSVVAGEVIEIPE